MVLEKKPAAEEEENTRGRWVMNGTIVACVRPPCYRLRTRVMRVPGLESTTLSPILFYHKLAVENV